jgi:hypothetical protein
VDEKTPGQDGYEGYCAKSEGKSIVTGALLPAWWNLPPKIKDAWEASAVAVLAADAERRKAENVPPR